MVGGGGGGLEQLQMREEDLQKQEQQRLEDRVSVCVLYNLLNTATSSIHLPPLDERGWG